MYFFPLIDPKYRYYICSETKCKQVIYPTNIKIPSFLPVKIDKIILFPVRVFSISENP